MGGDWHFLLEEEKTAGTFHSYWQLRQFNIDWCRGSTSIFDERATTQIRV
ncbi:hypothetical protein CDEST_00448 [Colletotrichum destructivum]|uniref:Uncharacterized protein n=1 Tax=Colletotrichum destructivum TaxID=34406 RepID=A0AAX4HX13_9PEZI|nr:hypothetical protein CDEST_00448 [Colletotrichum destructivum]